MQRHWSLVIIEPSAHYGKYAVLLQRCKKNLLSIPTGAQDVTLQIKSWWRNVNIYVGLAQEIGFSPAYLLNLLRLAGYRELQSSAPAREECNKYDLTPGSLFLIGQS